MKITNIKINHFLGLRHADITLTTPVTIIAGRNGAGKSSMHEAIRMAMLGEPTRISLKKDLAKLVTEGQKKGRVYVCADFGDFDIVLPSGDRHGALRQNQFMPFVLDMTQFSGLSANDRRRMLFDLTGCDTGLGVVKTKLLDRGANSKKIESVLPLLRAGFPAAEKEAKTKATEAKGAWRAVTSEAYGEKKAESWEADSFEQVPESEILQAENDLDVVDGTLAEANQSLGALRAQFQAAERQAKERAELEETAGKIDRITVKLEHDLKEQARMDAIVQRLYTLREAKKFMPCPCCGEKLAVVDGALVVADAIAVDEQVDDGILSDYEQSVVTLQRAVDNDRRDLLTAQLAAKQLESMQDEKPDAAALEAAETRVRALTQTRREFENKLQALRGKAHAAITAVEMTKKAAAHHTDVQEWLLIADALAPDGIPSELLFSAIGPVNKLLMGRSMIAGWGNSAAVAINQDMELTFDSRPYALLSESEKWRVDCLVSMVIAELSGLKLVLLDRMDVLDIPARGQLITLLDECARAGWLETVIVSGTLKTAPVGLPATMQSAWIENGQVAIGQIKLAA